jgi:hypothetical protein
MVGALQFTSQESHHEHFAKPKAAPTQGDAISQLRAKIATAVGECHTDAREIAAELERQADYLRQRQATTGAGSYSAAPATVVKYEGPQLAKLAAMIAGR